MSDWKVQPLKLKKNLDSKVYLYSNTLPGFTLGKVKVTSFQLVFIVLGKNQCCHKK